MILFSHMGEYFGKTVSVSTAEKFNLEFENFFHSMLPCRAENFKSSALSTVEVAFNRSRNNKLVWCFKIFILMDSSLSVCINAISATNCRRTVSGCHRGSVWSDKFVFTSFLRWLSSYSCRRCSSHILKTGITQSRCIIRSLRWQQSVSDAWHPRRSFFTVAELSCRFRRLRSNVPTTSRANVRDILRILSALHPPMVYRRYVAVINLIFSRILVSA